MFLLNLKSIAIAFSICVISCKSENSVELKNVPTLITTNAPSITQSTVSTGGCITADGGAAITARGVCWSTNPIPTIADNKTDDGSGTGSFSSSVTGLSAATKYYIRAYAINNAGTGYGEVVSFTTLPVSGNILTGVFKDPRDNKEYKTVKIGNQIWFAENLAFKPESGNYRAYNNDNSNVGKYGYLYDWPTAKNVCPTGWHLASDTEWTELTNYAGSNPGSKLKAATGWADNGNGEDKFGFSALPGGYHGSDGKFERMGGGAYFWTSTENTSSDAYGRGMASDNGNTGRGYDDKRVGYSVRCIKD